MSTSLKPYTNFKDNTKWLYDYLGIPFPQDNEEVDLAGQKFILQNGILRNQILLSTTQTQTEETFAFKLNAKW